MLAISARAGKLQFRYKSIHLRRARTGLVVAATAVANDLNGNDRWQFLLLRLILRLPRHIAGGIGARRGGVRGAVSPPRFGAATAVLGTPTLAPPAWILAVFKT